MVLPRFVSDRFPPPRKLYRFTAASLPTAYVLLTAALMGDGARVVMSDSNRPCTLSRSPRKEASCFLNSCANEPFVDMVIFFMAFLNAYVVIGECGSIIEPHFFIVFIILIVIIVHCTEFVHDVSTFFSHHLREFLRVVLAICELMQGFVNGLP